MNQKPIISLTEFTRKVYSFMEKKKRKKNKKENKDKTNNNI